MLLLLQIYNGVKQRVSDQTFLVEYTNLDGHLYLTSFHGALAKDWIWCQCGQRQGQTMQPIFSDLCACFLL